MSDTTKSHVGVRGLTNSGNTCFLNAVVQVTLHSPILRDVFLSGRLQRPAGELSNTQQIVLEVERLYQEINEGVLSDAISGERLYHAVSAACPQFADGRQHDAHELFHALMEHLTAMTISQVNGCELAAEPPAVRLSDINKCVHSLPQLVFGGTLCSFQKCTGHTCTAQTSRDDPFMDLSVPLQTPDQRSASPAQSSQSDSASGASTTHRVSPDSHLGARCYETKSCSPETALVTKREGSESPSGDLRGARVAEELWKRARGNAEDLGSVADTRVADTRHQGPSAQLRGASATADQAGHGGSKRATAAAACESKPCFKKAKVETSATAYDDALSRKAKAEASGNVSEEMGLSQDLAAGDGEESGPLTVEQCMHTFMQPERIEAHCDQCAARVDREKQLSINCAPPVLCLHLNRFNQAARSKAKQKRALLTTQKDTQKVLFPQLLDLRPFSTPVMMAERSTGSDGGGGGPGGAEAGDVALPQDLLYDLYGVIEHKGKSLDSGHYVAYVLKQKQWYLCNDTDVRKVDVATVLKAEAYMLFYRSAGIKRG